MVRGEDYDSRDPELLAMAHRARGLLSSFAAVASEDGAARRAILVQLLAAVGDGVWIEPPFFCDYGHQVSIGADTFVNVNCVFLDSAAIKIGSNVLIGPGVQLITATHPLRAVERIVPADERRANEATYRTHARPIVIGDGAGFGAGSIVFGGVTIGENTSIGAGSIVTSDIQPNCLAFGQPARVQRRL
jgi:maltose O-acetyltransferase